MHFQRLPIKDAYILQPKKFEDPRGFFATCFSESDFCQNGLETAFSRWNNSLSIDKGTLRGIHFQHAPQDETKLVRCTAGAIWDLILDLRENSPTFGQWYGNELTAENRTMMYIPKGCGHGFLTLKPHSEVFYLASNTYTPESEGGVRWNDPYFNITWPFEPTTLSNKDASIPLW